MPTRRDLFKLTVATGLAATTGVHAAPTPSMKALPSLNGSADRDVWRALALRLAVPVLDALARRRLKIEMPVERHPSAKGKPNSTHLEALGRVLCGVAPWLELGTDATPEGAERARVAQLAREAIDAGTDPQSPDYMVFANGRQPLVDAAFLSQALLRAPNVLWKQLGPRVQANVIAFLRSSRVFQGGENNWKLFATTVEVFLHYAGAQRDEVRLMEGITRHKDWYVGDGAYGDGPEFHWDYYNSYVIQPMFTEALEVLAGESAELLALRDKQRVRLTRWAAVQERMIAPDGSYPVLGRSIAYRCGAFQGLALAALRKLLPEEVQPAQARVALTSVIRRTLEAPGTWDAKGWLQIGLNGHQPGLGEPYISTGSSYLCCAALLPLGLAATDPFWSAPPVATTWERAWSGADLPSDHALKSPR